MSENSCAYCGRALNGHSGLRHFGTYTTHQESTCRKFLKSEIADLRAQLATARVEALREAAETRPNEYSVYGSDRTGAYARGFCGGVESSRRAILALIDKETDA